MQTLQIRVPSYRTVEFCCERQLRTGSRDIPRGGESDTKFRQRLLFPGGRPGSSRFRGCSQSLVDACFGTPTQDGSRSQCLGGHRGHVRRLRRGLTATRKGPRNRSRVACERNSGAQLLIAKGDLRGAEATLQNTLKRNPTSLPALALLLKVDAAQGRGEEAVGRLTSLVQKSPQNAGLHFLLGLAYFNLKNLQDAEASVRRALNLDPKTPDAYTLLANIAFAKGSLEEAKSYLKMGIATFPRNINNYIALTTEYEKEGNWEEAKRSCEKAHEVAPASPMVADELAFLYLEHGGDVNVAVALAQGAEHKLPTPQSPRMRWDGLTTNSVPSIQPWSSSRSLRRRFPVILFTSII